MGIFVMMVGEIIEGVVVEIEVMEILLGYWSEIWLKFELLY